MMDAKVEGGKLQLDLRELLREAGPECLREIIDALACEEQVFDQVGQQILEDTTDFGSSTTTHRIRELRKKLAEKTGLLATKAIQDLQRERDNILRNLEQSQADLSKLKAAWPMAPDADNILRFVAGGPPWPRYGEGSDRERENERWAQRDPETVGILTRAEAQLPRPLRGSLSQAHLVEALKVADSTLLWCTDTGSCLRCDAKQDKALPFGYRHEEFCPVGPYAQARAAVDALAQAEKEIPL